MIDETALKKVEQTQHARTPSFEQAKATALALRVTDTPSYERASGLAKQARAAWAALDAERTAITKPILEGKRRVDAFFKPALDALHAIELHLKSELAKYHTAQQLARAAVMQESAQQIQAGIVPTAPVPEVPAVKGVSVRVHWDFEVIDASAVPRELCSPDAAKIREAIWYADTPHTPPQPIPGLRFFLKADTTVRK